MQFKYGIVSDVKAGYIKASFEEDEIVTDWLPVVQRKSKSDKESLQLEINEHIVCLMDANCNEGICLGAIPNEKDTPDPGEGKGKFRKLFSDGTLIEYDKSTHKLTVDVKGQLEAKTTGKASIEAGTILEGNATVKATITAPIIELSGNVIVSGTLAAASLSIAPGAGPVPGSGKVEIAGDIELTGKITGTGEISGSDIKAGGVSLKKHTHTGVTTGPGTSGPPVP
ncbi:MAG: phage baseplate assembly protein V [Ginsengibacter sp.]